ncbi:unnamed protein product [[Candida] boidinii]|nr:unnamed protein product [[Candida] boidinii]
MTLHEFLGFLLLYGIHNPAAEARVLDGNLSVDFRDLDVTLGDLFVASDSSTSSTSSTSSPSTVLATTGASRPPRRKNYNNNSSKKICKRCGKPGHISIYCPAPAPLSLAPPSSPSGTSSTPSLQHSSSATANSVWMVNSAFTPLDSTNPDQYWLDSGSSVHLSNKKAHFRELSSCSGVIAGVGGHNLNVEGNGSSEAKRS